MLHPDENLTPEAQEFVPEDTGDAPDRTNVEPEPIPLLSLHQFCASIEGRVPVETLSLFYELETNAGHIRGTFTEFQQRLVDLQNQPL